MAQNTPQTQLYDMLISKDFEPQQFNGAGAPVIDPEDVDIIRFEYKTPDGKNYGTVQVLFTEDGEMSVFFGDNVGKTMEPEHKQGWFSFLEQLRFFAKRHRLTFNLENISRLKYKIKNQQALSESLMESLMGNSRQSWSAPDSSARLLIYHDRRLGENDQRHRHIDRIFVETTDGERFRLPFRNLAGARAMLEHVRQGGRPYDARGTHIAEMVTELNTLSRFRRAHQNRVFEGEAHDIIQEANQYYEARRRDLKRLGTAHGYATYFESWQPGEITQADELVEDLRSMFVEQTLDQRIDAALPLLARLRSHDMREAQEFEDWTQAIAEGTWAVPDTAQDQERLQELLANPLPVGPDATNATELLYDIFGDDELFDQLSALAMDDPDADARDLVLARMQELGMEMPVTDTAAEPAAPEAPTAPVAPEAPMAPQPVAEQDDAETTIQQLAQSDPEIAKIAAFDSQGRLDVNRTMHRAIKTLLSMGPDMLGMMEKMATKLEGLSQRPGIDLYDRKRALDTAQAMRAQIPVLKNEFAKTQQQYDTQLKPRAFREDLDVIKHLALYRSR